MFDVIVVETSSRYGDVEVEAYGESAYLSQPNERDRDVLVLRGPKAVRDLIAALEKALAHVESFDGE